jgi:hypothetical protein
MSIIQNKAFFVTPEYIFQNFAMYIDNNLDANSINSAILIAQNEQTQQVLGYTLYQKYIDLVTTGQISQTQNSNYKYLLDNYIVDSVSLWSLWYSLDSIHLRVTNKSVELKNSQYSSPVSASQLTKLKINVLERAQFVDSRTREYILNYPGDFPEYYQVTGVMRMTPKRNPYTNFFMTGKSLSGPDGGCNGCNGYKPGVGVYIWGTP